MGDSMTSISIAHINDAALATKAFAAGASFPTSVETALFSTPEDVLAAVKADVAGFAVLTIESAASGTNHSVYDLLLKYQLVIVSEYVEDEGVATSTRHLLLTKETTASAQLAPVNAKTSLVFAFSDGDKSGQLHRALGVFASRDISLAKIESRSWSTVDADAVGAAGASFLFYADIAGHQHDPLVMDALTQLRALCHYVRVLGSYSSSALEVAVDASVMENKVDDMTVKYPLNSIFDNAPLAKTITIYSMAKQLEADGQTVYSLAVGQPDFAPPDRVIQAAIRALEERKVQYSDMRGDSTLRKLIAEHLSKAKAVTYDPETEIQVSNGGQQALFMALYALIRPGDKVIVPSPYWSSYEAMVKQVRAGLVILRGRIEEDFLINPKALEETLTANPDTKVLVLCNPSNPVGTLHSPEHLEQIAAVLRKPQFRHVVVISDEIYDQIVFQDEGEQPRVHKSFAALPDMYERTVLINGFSKAYAMTGLRIGYVAGPRHFVHPCLLLQAQLTSTANMVSQLAAAEALREELECMEQGCVRIAEVGVLRDLDEKRQYVVQRLRAIPNLQFAYPTAAFYLFMDLSSYFRGKKAYSVDRKHVLHDVADFCEFLLRNHHVATGPGVDYGEEFGLRLSYASSMETLVHAMDGIEQTLNSLTFE